MPKSPESLPEHDSRETAKNLSPSEMIDLFKSSLQLGEMKDSEFTKAQITIFRGGVEYRISYYEEENGARGVDIYKGKQKVVIYDGDRVTGSPFISVYTDGNRGPYKNANSGNSIRNGRRILNEVLGIRSRRIRPEVREEARKIGEAINKINREDARTSNHR